MDGEKVGALIKSYLGMNHGVIGIKILEERICGNKPSKAERFCNLVRRSLKGQTYVIGRKNLSCSTAEVTLGFDKPRYLDFEPRIKSKTRAVRIGPIENCDVVLFTLNPKQAMVMSILLGGIEARFKGEMGICGEAVAKVYNEKRANLSFLCNGARDYGGFRENEVVLGLPYPEFLKLPLAMKKFVNLGKSKAEPKKAGR
ncbi:MAG: DUF169 domain-containing protein [bacterium]